METTKSKRGGVREGAGRKRMGDELKENLTVRLSPAALQRLEEIATAKGVSKSVCLEEMITQTYTDKEREAYVNTNAPFCEGRFKWMPEGVSMYFRLAVVDGVVVGCRTYDDRSPIFPLEMLAFKNDDTIDDEYYYNSVDAVSDGTEEYFDDGFYNR